jgi:hypothetical protein
LIYADQERWRRAGQYAFLAYQGQRYDREITAAQSETALVIVASLLVLGLCAFYECTSYVGHWLLDKILGPGPPDSNMDLTGFESSN